MSNQRRRKRQPTGIDWKKETQKWGGKIKTSSQKVYRHGKKFVTEQKERLNKEKIETKEIQINEEKPEVSKEIETPQRQEIRNEELEKPQEKPATPQEQEIQKPQETKELQETTTNEEIEETQENTGKSKISLKQFMEGVEGMSGERRHRVLRQKEDRIARKVISFVIIAFLTVIVIAGITLTAYWKNGQKPLDPNVAKTKLVEIPIGSSNKQIGAILEKDKIIRSKEVFNYYMKLHNQSEFQAGFYKLAPNMTLDYIAEVLKEGKSVQQVLAIPEGYNIDQIADALDRNTHLSKVKFLEAMKDKKLFNKLLKKYPKLLTSASKAKNVRYPLEGYLFPATYDITPGGDLETLINQMVEKANAVLTPYYEEIKKQNMTVQEVMTLASLVEKEGVRENDRKEIAGVFFNRLEAEMPLQSDVSIHYAKGEYKEKVSIKDTKIDSPYNLYVHTGYGPGPYNNPSESAINAVLHPISTDNYYFVADIKTGMIYFSSNLEDHNALVEKYVNNN